MKERLGNRDGWKRHLDDAVVDALERWLPGGYRLDLESWFDDGRSGEPVGRVTLNYDNGNVAQAVIKFFKDDNRDRINNLRNAPRNSGDFGRHLAEVFDRTDDLGGWRAVFMALASGGLKRVKQLTELTGDHDFPSLCGQITESIIHGWNPGRPRQQEGITVGKLLEGLLRPHKRLRLVKNWLRDREIDVTRSDGSFETRLKRAAHLTNPFVLVEGHLAALPVPHLVIGNAHGDLNGRNILVPRNMPDSELYHLIDYDRFEDDAPLARDPMNLLVSLALDFRAKLNDRRLDPVLAELLVNPDADVVDYQLGNFRQACLEVHRRTTPRREWALHDEWSEQCQLALVGVALRRLGRKDTDDDNVKEWCLYLAARATESFVESRKSPEPHAAVTASIHAVRDAHGMVDRQKDLRDLHTRLAGGTRGVAMLLGTRGIGKTKLVDAAVAILKDVENTAPSPHLPRVHRHSVDVAGPLDAKTLVNYLQDTGRERESRDDSAVVRLETVLKALGDTPVVVVVDGVDSLLEPDSKQLVDPYLDAALETVATEDDHQVTVLLVSREQPASPRKHTWSNADGAIPLRRFDPPELREYWESLARQYKRNQEETSLDDIWPGLYRGLQGNPRLAELAHAVVGIARTDLDLKSLTNVLGKQLRTEVHNYLTLRMLEGLKGTRKRVIRALAAFGTHVPASAVMELVPEKTSATVKRALRDLAANRVIHEVVKDRYAVPRDEAALILRAMPEDTEVLYFRAATQLGFLRHPDPHSVGDLRTHFAEIRALLNAGEHGSAYGIISLTHDVLDQWNCEHLLLTEREEVRLRLQNELDAMSNHNALARIYESLGKRGAAEEFQAALSIAGQHEWNHDIVKIHVNLARMHWGRGHFKEALDFYKEARKLAVRFDDQMALMSALEGIARCQQRRGRYQRAMKLAEAALLLPDHPSFPDTAKALTFAATRRIEISLWLARRHIELGRRHDAERMVDAALDIRKTRSNDWLLAPCLDGRADLLFDLERFDEAREAAVHAVALAQKVHNEEVLQRARVTLAMIYLSTDQSPQAWNEIDKLRRLPHSRGSLFALALHALAGHQKEYEARTRFEDLFTESTERTMYDRYDFAAWNFRGFALCGLHLHRGDDLAEAVTSFRAAQALTPPSRILTGRIRFLVEQLHENDRLRTALDALT
ncbi:tetratricopeptide repeat protein [Lentzea sp. NPDC034063]|uniref:tetratricopeptide repeat protein n=1 Tax=unclassified Lentzea TaxID=2643253 RepID=UPI0033C207D6